MGEAKVQNSHLRGDSLHVDLLYTNDLVLLAPNSRDLNTARSGWLASGAWRSTTPKQRQRSLPCPLPSPLPRSKINPAACQSSRAGQIPRGNSVLLQEYGAGVARLMHGAAESLRHRGYNWRPSTMPALGRCWASTVAQTAPPPLSCWPPPARPAWLT